MQRSVFTHARWAVQTAVLLTLGSVWRYPGGTRLDHAASGYSFSHNFLSDLGMTVTYSGHPNVLGAVLFTSGLCIVAFGLGWTLVGFWQLHAESARSRRFAGAATGAGFIVATALLGIALTPENYVLDLHITFVQVAFRVFPFVPLLLSLASLTGRVLPGRVAVAWAVLTFVLTAYILLIGFGPTTATPSGLVLQITAQKVTTISIVVIFLYSAVEAERVVASRRRVATELVLRQQQREAA